MKTIIVPTNLSAAANNAARYAMQLAKNIRSHVLLCNAMLIPIEAPSAGLVVWPLEDLDSIKTAIDKELNKLATKLELDDRELSPADSYQPTVTCHSEIGKVTDVVSTLVNKKKAGMVVMGMSGAKGLNRLFMGSNSRDMMDNASFPVLLIPADFNFTKIKKIAFATDLSTGDIESIHCLALLAHNLNAEITIIHVTNKKHSGEESKELVTEFLNTVANMVNYPKIYYRAVDNLNIDEGLEWVTEHAMADMIAMVHRPHGFIDKLLNNSHTQSLAKYTPIPLMVLPGNYCTTF